MKKEKDTAVKKPALSWYKRMDFSKKMALWGFIFMLPWLLGMLLFFLEPLLKMLWYSVCSMSLDGGKFRGTYIGFENYKYAMGGDPHFNRMLVEAFTNMAKAVPFQIFLALFIAILLNGEYKGRGFFRAIFVIPIILATGVASFKLREAELAVATVESVVDLDWLIDLVVNSGIPEDLTTMLVEYVENIFDVVTTCGVQTLLFLGALQAISPSLYEVAKMEGCSQFETFCKITLPMVSPTILVCLVYSIADTFATAQVSYADTTMAFSQYIYDITFKGQAPFYGYGAAMSFIYFLAALVTVGVVCGIVSKGVFYYD
jgi:ABC-type sugar transport system permease subunit